MKKNHPILNQIISGSISQPLIDIRDLVKNKLVYVISVDNIKWNMNRSLQRYLRTNDEVYMQGGSTNKLVFQTALIDGNLKFCSPIMFKGTPILIKSELSSDRAEINYEDHQTEQRKYATMTFQTIKTKKNVKNVHRFIKHLLRENAKICIKDFGTELTEHYEQRGDKWIKNPKLRTFDDIFLPKALEDKIKASLDAFMAKRDWYIKNNIPYHFGILLYGEPGTGKSVTAQAIIKYVKANTHLFTGDCMNSFARVAKSSMLDNGDDPLFDDKYNVVLIEDIDCADIVKDREYKYQNMKLAKEEKSGLASVLNAMDGIGSPENVIYIFTTNHIEQIDPALIRPGRIDLSIEIPIVNKETLEEFVIKYYDRRLPIRNDINIAPDVTFASLQVEVMKGASYDELIKYVEGGSR